MFDKLLEVGSIFDWITPAFAFIADLAHWPPFTIEITGARGGMKWGDVAKLLHKSGVKTWGEMWVDERLIFTVPKRQRQLAARVLDKNGVSWR